MIPTKVSWLALLTYIADLANLNTVVRTNGRSSTKPNKGVIRQKCFNHATYQLSQEWDS